MLATETQRIEIHTDLDTEALITQAARLTRQSVSEFVLRAATEEASRVIARIDHVMMPSDQFDALISSLATPDDAPKIARAAEQRRRFIRR
jgi:uncharacterized protein (DUF1778 family)